jgi:hypothetical protein
MNRFRIGRRMLRAALGLPPVLALGCYTFVPSGASYLAGGKPVAIEINDLGRINLSPQIGADVARVAGILEQQTGTEYTVRVNELTYLNGKTAEWIGERVTIRQDFVRGVYERKFSRGKTTAAVLASAGIVAGVIAGKSLTGSGDKLSGGDTKPPPGGGTTSRGNQ